LPISGQTVPAPQPAGRELTGAEAEQVKTLQRSRERLTRLGRLTEAQAATEEVLTIRRRVLGEDHVDTARSYDELAALERVQRRYAEAEPLLRKALEIRRRVLGEDHRDTIDSYNSLAMLLQTRGKLAEAEPLLQKALETCLRVLGEDHVDTARSYNNLAALQHAEGKYADSERSFQRALSICRRVRGEEHRDTASGYNNLAMLFLSQGNYSAAEPLLQRALSIYRRVLGEYYPETAGVYNNLGYLFSAQGRYAESGPLFEKALAIRRRLLGENNPETARSYNSVAVVMAAEGKYAEAEALHQTALAIVDRALGEDHVETAQLDASLAGTLGAQGRYAEAEFLLRKALAVCRRVLGAEHRDTAVACDGLAGVLQAEGKNTEAEPLLREALGIRRRVLGENHAETARSYERLAALLQAEGKLAEAEPQFLRALGIRRRVLGEAHPDTARSCNSLAILMQTQGRYAEAEPLFQNALGICSRVLGEANRDTARCAENLAFLEYLQGNYADAVATGTDAAERFETARRPSRQSGQERITRAGKHPPFALPAALLARLGEPAAAWDLLESGLARGFCEDGARALNPAELHREGELLSRVQRLEDPLIKRALVPDSDPLFRQEWDALVEKRQAAQSNLDALEMALDQKYGAAVGQPMDLAEIQHRLPADAALVAWIDMDAAAGAANPGGEHWACVVRSEGAPAWVALPGSGAGGAWTKADDRLPAEVAEGLSRPPDGAGAPWKEAAAGAALAARRIDPLEPRLAPSAGLPAVKRLIVLPSPGLGGVPVDVLLEARPQARPRYTVSYAPSGSLLVWLRGRPRVEPREPGEVPRRLLAVADPAFEQPDARSTPPPPLPATRREARTIAALFTEAETLLGADASQERLAALAAADELHRFDVLHLATYAVASARFPMLSVLRLAGDVGTDATDRALKGLPVYDGALTAAQILRTWKLDAELVVLSTRLTGPGQATGGAFDSPFSRALLLTGARSLVLSLWKGDDTATLLVMTRFYANLLGRRAGLNRPLPRAEALAEAKRWLRGLTGSEVATALAALEPGSSAPRAEPRPSSPPAASSLRPFAHPHFWAGFILVGDPG
jgi:CHAT domain-containing protein/tetratricopeptide (TPR) repeat protein